MKYVRIDLSENLSRQEVVVISDLHIGSKHYDEIALLSRLKRVIEHNQLIILNGDLMNANLKDSVGSVYGEELNPSEQLDKLINIFHPYKEKIIGITSGNHEERIWKSTGIEVMKIFADSLGKSDCYHKDALLIHLRLGDDGHQKKIGYTVYITHGWSNGRGIGSKMNAIRELRNVILADCYICGHTHTQGCVFEDYFIPDLKNGKILRIKQAFVSSGGYLGYGDYLERKGYSPSKIGSPTLIFDGRRKDLHVVV